MYLVQMKPALDINHVNEYVKRGLVKFQLHPTKDLVIWNYTDVVQMKQIWDDITSTTRGLITKAKGDIIARSFPKFHNIEQNLHTPSPRFKIYEKLDGSLGILFHHNDDWIICSRGSFTSEQARIAETMLHVKYDISMLDTSLAYSFEIIHPSNRIVVDYGDRSELVFLAAFSVDGVEHTDTCIDMITRAGFPVAKTYEYEDYSNIKGLNWNNAEGFVVRFDNGQRVKIKFEDYLALHRVVTNLNALRVWQAFDQGFSLEKAIESVPDEFHGWYSDTYRAFSDRYHDVLTKHERVFDNLLSTAQTRKDFACALNELKDNQVQAKILFRMYNKQDVHHIISQMVRPQDGTLDVPSGRKQAHHNSNVNDVRDSPKKMIIAVGPSASGKSTWASEHVNNNINWVRVNRDMLRKQLYGYEDLRIYHNDPRKRHREKCVTDAEVALIRDMLARGYSVVVDNTNLRKEYIDAYVQKFKNDCEIEFKLFTDVPIEMCIERDHMRLENDRVGHDVIKKQFDMMHVLTSKYTFQTVYPKDIKPIEQDESLPKGYVFDIDGTIADNNHRDPYDWSKVIDDTAIEASIHTLKSHHMSGHKIVLCSGRDAVCEQSTVEWLEKHNVPYDNLYMRPKGDRRPDWYVKEEMWRDISRTMYIIAMYDDRDSVVKHGRACGLKVYQVEYGNF